MTTDEARAGLKELGRFLIYQDVYINPYLYVKAGSAGAVSYANVYVLDKPYGHALCDVKRVQVWNSDLGVLKMGAWILDLDLYAQKLKQAEDAEREAAALADNAVLAAYISNTGNTQ